jgi:hypothetical protein
MICALTHDDPTRECGTETLLLDIDATLEWQKQIEPGSVHVRVAGLPLRRGGDGIYRGEKAIDVVDYVVSPFECYTHTYEITPLSLFRVTALMIESPPKGPPSMSMSIDPGIVEEKITHICNGNPSMNEQDTRTVYNLGMTNLVPGRVTNWQFGQPGETVFAGRTITGFPAEYTGKIKFELTRPNLETAQVCGAKAPGQFAFAPGWISQVMQAPAPPIPAIGTAGLDIATEQNASGEIVAATVKLNNREGMYVAWTQTKRCGKAAGEGLAARKPSDVLYTKTGQQPSLRTYDRIGANGGTIDGAQTDLNWNATYLAECIGYIKTKIDANRPAYIGVNERGKKTFKVGSATALANDGIVDHFLLIHGYRVELVNNKWKVTKLYAVDNAAGLGLTGRYPEFTVADGEVRKAATKANPDPYSDPSIELEYQLAQVWAYKKDLETVKKMTAWWDL